MDRGQSGVVGFRLTLRKLRVISNQAAEEPALGAPFGLCLPAQAEGGTKGSAHHDRRRFNSPGVSKTGENKVKIGSNFVRFCCGTARKEAAGRIPGEQPFANLKMLLRFEVTLNCSQAGV